MKGGLLLIKSKYDIASNRPTGIIDVTREDQAIADEFLKEYVQHFSRLIELTSTKKSAVLRNYVADPPVDIRTEIYCNI